jgi:hypothetical protein
MSSEMRSEHNNNKRRQISDEEVIVDCYEDCEDEVYYTPPPKKVKYRKFDEHFDNFVAYKQKHGNLFSLRIHDNSLYKWQLKVRKGRIANLTNDHNETDWVEWGWAKQELKETIASGKISLNS